MKLSSKKFPRLVTVAQGLNTVQDGRLAVKALADINDAISRLPFVLATLQ